MKSVLYGCTAASKNVLYCLSKTVVRLPRKTCCTAALNLLYSLDFSTDFSAVRIQKTTLSLLLYGPRLSCLQTAVQTSKKRAALNSIFPPSKFVPSCLKLHALLLLYRFAEYHCCCHPSHCSIKSPALSFSFSQSAHERMNDLFLLSLL